MFIFWKLLKAIIWLMAVLALGLVGLLLAAKYVLTPQLDQWRPELEEWVQQKTQLPFQVGNMQLHWQTLTPQLNLHNVTLGVGDDQKIQVQDLSVELDPSSLMTLKPQAKSLSLKGLQMLVERSHSGEISILNKVLNADKGNLVAQMPKYQDQLKAGVENWLSWVFEKLPNHVYIQNARIVWRDGRRAQAADLVFQPVEVALDHDQQHLKAQVRISPPQQAGSFLQLDAEFQRNGDGEVQLSWKDWHPNYFKEWLYFPLVMQQGVIKKAQGEFQFRSAELNQFSVQTVLNDFVFLEREEQEDHALVVQGDLADLTISSKTGLQHPYHFDIKAQKLYVEADDYFRHPMDFTDIRMQGIYDLNKEQRTRLQFEKFIAELPSGKVDLTGSWEVDIHSDSGIVDLHGNIPHMALNKLPDYLPKTIDSETLDWLENAFLTGTVENANVKVQGVVDHIPFGLHPQSGDFRIQGQVKDLTLHYHQDSESENVYPNIIVPVASVDFNRQNIYIRGENFTLDSALGEDGIHVRQADVSVNNIEQNSAVDIQASLATTGEGVLAFYQQSPLQEVLSHALDKSLFTGQVEGNLAIHIPILNTDDSTVKGDFTLKDASFQLSPDYPMLTKAAGVVRVSERNVQLDKVTGYLLGGAASLDGFIGAKGDRLSINGSLTTAGLYDYLRLSGVQKRLKGGANYKVDITFLGGKNVDATLHSDLKGLALDLPAPLTKKAAASADLSVHLLAPQSAITVQDSKDNTPMPASIASVHQRAKTADRLSVNYKNLQILLERNDRTKPQFNRGFVAIGVDKPTMPNRHLRVEAQEEEVNVGDWLDLVDEFSDNKPSSSNILPDAAWVDISANKLSLYGAYINNALLQGSKEDHLWRFSVKSPDALGSFTLHINRQNHTLDEIGLALDKLTFRREKTEDSIADTKSKEDKTVQRITVKESEHIPRRIDLPGVKGQIKQLSLPDHVLGQLNIDSQRKDKNTWQLHSLSVTNDVGSLYAAGSLTSQANRTTGDIKLNINAVNTAKFLQYFGYLKDFRAGKGFINAYVTSDDVSAWDLDHLNVKGQMQVNNGAFLQVNSNAMRVLALVSLQSFAGLSSLAGKSPSVLSKGLPFDYMRSSFTLDNGKLALHDFRLNGPLVALVAAGQTHLRNETLDVEIAAIPKIEMSGAAVLAGVIVNPVVGVGAFLSQWLLTTPLNRALTAYFDVGGTWDNPELKDKSLPTDKELKERNQ